MTVKKQTQENREGCCRELEEILRKVKSFRWYSIMTNKGRAMGILEREIRQESSV